MSLRGIDAYIMDLFGKGAEKAGLFPSEIRLNHVKVDSTRRKHFQ
jgi:hypothetical protein